MIGHLFAIPSGAHAEFEPAAGENVNTGDLFGSDDRIPLDEQADPAAHPQLRGGHGGCCQGDEEVVGVRVHAGQLTAARIAARPAGRDM